MTLPTFLLLGAARAGTTSLHRWLAQHPDVCMSRPKETQFFSLHHHRGPEHYRTHFVHHAGEPAVGESTPVYLTLPHVPDRVADLLPGAQLVAILREPVGQAFSTWWMFRSLGAEPRSFEQAVEDELARGPVAPHEAEETWRAVLAAAERGRPVPSSHYLQTGHYADALRRYRARFPAEQLTILLHDDLATDPAAVTAALARAVGVDPARAASPVPPRVNQSTGPREAWARRRVQRVPSARVRKAAARAARLLDRQGPPRLAPETRARLTEHFAAANADLGALVGRDVSHWFRAPTGRAA